MNRTARSLLCSLSLVALAGCGISEGPPLVSAQYPPGTGVVNSASEPLSLNGLPPGAANVWPGVGATAPSYLSITFAGR